MNTIILLIAYLLSCFFTRHVNKKVVQLDKHYPIWPFAWVIPFFNILVMVVFSAIYLEEKYKDKKVFQNKLFRKFLGKDWRPK